MTNRWILPDGVEEVLPHRALRIEQLRRRILDMYHRWGYDLVIPPLVEFTESLLSGTGADLDLMTFKLTDQLSGKMMGVRADMTPQITRMDAHSIGRKGPNRLCYAGTVLYTKPRHPLESRSPIQIGAELYGEPSLEADVEVISLMIATLQLAGVQQPQLDLGHVGIYRSLIEQTSLSEQQQTELFDLLQGKAIPELEQWLSKHLARDPLGNMFRALVDLSGDISVLDRARETLSDAPAEVELALDELQAVVAGLQTRYPTLEVYIDLSELRGYHYHTGIVFGGYCYQGESNGQAIGYGGRYDHVGAGFGRSRAATGFNLSLHNLSRLMDASGDDTDTQWGIFAPAEEAYDEAQQQIIDTLREQGERVVCGFPEQVADFSELQCDRQLVKTSDGYQVKAIN